MSTIWQTLGLEGPTSDLKMIKKAYARKLREVRPDEDPAGFMALRGAFDSAKRMAPYLEEAPVPEFEPETFVPPKLANQHETEANSEEEEPEIIQPGDARPWTYEVDDDFKGTSPEQETLEIESGNWPPELPDRPAPPEIETIENIPPFTRRPETVKGEDEKLMERIRALSQQNLHNDRKEWDSLLEKRFELSIDEYQQFEFALRNYLICIFDDAEIQEYGELDFNDNSPLKNPPLNGDIIKLIITHMGWETSKSLYTQGGLDEITRLKFKAGTIRRQSTNYNFKAQNNRPSGQQDDGSGFPFWLIIFLAVIGMNMFRMLGDQGGYKSPAYDSARMAEIRKLIEAENNSPLVDLSYPSGRSFEDIGFDEYFDLLKQTTNVAERVNQRRFENYLMDPETDISFLISAKNDKTLSVEKQVILELARSRMRSRWTLQQRFGQSSDRFAISKDLSPQMQSFLGIQTSNPSQNLNETMKMLEGLSVDPSEESDKD